MATGNPSRVRQTSAQSTSSAKANNNRVPASKSVAAKNNAASPSAASQQSTSAANRNTTSKAGDNAQNTNAAGTSTDPAQPVKRGRPRGRPLGSTTKNKKKKPSQMLMDNERKKKRRMVTIGPSSSLLTMYEALTTVLLNSLGNAESTMANLKVIAQHTCKGWSVPPAELATDLQIVLSVFKVIGLIDYKMQDPGVKKLDKVIELATRGDFVSTFSSFDTTGLEVAIQYLLSGIKPGVPEAFKTKPAEQGTQSNTGASAGNKVAIANRTSKSSIVDRPIGNAVRMTMARSSAPNPSGNTIASGLNRSIGQSSSIPPHSIVRKPISNQSNKSASMPHHQGGISTGNSNTLVRRPGNGSIAPAAMTMTVSAVTTKALGEHDTKANAGRSIVNHHINDKMGKSVDSRSNSFHQTTNTNRIIAAPISTLSSQSHSVQRPIHRLGADKVSMSRQGVGIGQQNKGMIMGQSKMTKPTQVDLANRGYPKVVTRPPVLCTNWFPLAKEGEWSKIHELSGGKSTNRGAVLATLCRLIAKEKRPEWGLYPQIMAALGAVVSPLEAKYGPNAQPSKLVDGATDGSGGRSRPQGSKNSRAAAAAALLRYPSPETPSTIVSVHKEQDRVLASVDHYVARAIDLKVRKAQIMFKEELLLSEISEMCKFPLPESKSIRPLPVDMAMFARSQRPFLPGSPRILPPEVEFRLSTSTSSQSRGRGSGDKLAFSQERTFNSEDENRARVARRRVREVQRQLIKKKKHPAYIALAQQAEETAEANANGEQSEQSQGSTNPPGTPGAGDATSAPQASASASSGTSALDERKGGTRQKFAGKRKQSYSGQSTPGGRGHKRLRRSMEANISCTPLAKEVAGVQFEVCTELIPFAGICEELFRGPVQTKQMADTPGMLKQKGTESRNQSFNTQTVSTSSSRLLKQNHQDLKRGNNFSHSVNSKTKTAMSKSSPISVAVEKNIDLHAASNASVALLSTPKHQQVMIPRWRIVPMIPMKKSKQITEPASQLSNTGVSMAKETAGMKGGLKVPEEDFSDATFLKRHDQALELAKSQWENEAEEKKKSSEQTKKLLKRESSKSDVKSDKPAKLAVQDAKQSSTLTSPQGSSAGAVKTANMATTKNSLSVSTNLANSNPVTASKAQEVISLNTSPHSEKRFTSSVVASNMLSGKETPQPSPTGSEAGLKLPQLPVLSRATFESTANPAKEDTAQEVSNSSDAKAEKVTSTIAKDSDEKNAEKEENGASQVVKKTITAQVEKKADADSTKATSNKRPSVAKSEEDLETKTTHARKKLRSPTGSVPVSEVASAKSKVSRSQPSSPTTNDAPRKSGRLRTARKLYEAE